MVGLTWDSLSLVAGYFAVFIGKVNGFDQGAG